MCPVKRPRACALARFFLPFPSPPSLFSHTDPDKMPGGKPSRASSFREVYKPPPWDFYPHCLSFSRPPSLCSHFFLPLLTTNSSLWVDTTFDTIILVANHQHRDENKEPMYSRAVQKHGAWLGPFFRLHPSHVQIFILIRCARIGLLELRDRCQR